MADLSLLGGLVIASADTAGTPSLGWRGRHAARRVAEAVAQTAGERSAPVIIAARKRGGEALGATLDRAEALAAEANTEARRLARR